MTTNASTKKPRLRAPVIAWLLLVFFGPLLAASYLYFGAGEWRPAGTTHHGDLLDPAVPLPDISLPTFDGDTRSGFLKQVWTLAYVGDGRCDNRCRQALTDMRQIRLALGNDRDRVRRLFIVRGGAPDRGYLKAEHAGLLIVDANIEAGEILLGGFPVFDGVPVDQARRIYVIDPMANLMMSYPADSVASDILKDLKHMLQLSNIG